jgi:hypothetical protein
MICSVFFYLLSAAMGLHLIHGESLVDSSTKRLRTANIEQPTYRRLISETQKNQIDHEEDPAEAFKAMREALEALVSEAILSFDPSVAPTGAPSDSPSESPSTAFSNAPSHVPTSVPVVTPVAPPVAAPITPPIVPPVAAPVAPPVVAPTVIAPTVIAPVIPPVVEPPTITTCPGITEQERISQILAILDAVADPDDIRDNNTPQGLATTWLIAQDGFKVCPDYPKLVQRWTLAVMYFSTDGNAWFQCSARPGATDNCGSESPFEAKRRFLSSGSECDWAGISCIDGCVTQVEYGTSYQVMLYSSTAKGRTLTNSCSVRTFRGQQFGRYHPNRNGTLVHVVNLGYGTWTIGIDHSDRDCQVDQFDLYRFRL